MLCALFSVSHGHFIWNYWQLPRPWQDMFFIHLACCNYCHILIKHVLPSCKNVFLQILGLISFKSETARQIRQMPNHLITINWLKVVQVNHPFAPSVMRCVHRLLTVKEPESFPVFLVPLFGWETRGKFILCHSIVSRMVKLLLQFHT